MEAEKTAAHFRAIMDKVVSETFDWLNPMLLTLDCTFSDWRRMGSFKRG